MNYLDALKQSTNQTFTENGALSNLSTLDPVLDFFSRAGAMREDIPGAVRLFKLAYVENPLLAIRCLFYLRDIRGGQGDRDLFRNCLGELEFDDLNKVAKYVPEYGRWDDILSHHSGEIVQMVINQLASDELQMEKGETVSLLAKWMPSENTSSKETRREARCWAKQLELTPTKYRKRIVKLRNHIKLLETKMSHNNWGEIDYEKIPSQAHRKHVKAFKRHDETRYSQYLAAVEKGEKKIKTSTLFTYEVFDLISKDEQVANVMWDNLPDYTNGTNALVVADVSGSMSGRPMSISVSLALYFAERNKGVFNGYFMTFSDNSRLVKVVGNTLAQKLRNIENAEWGGSTNLESSFRAILNAAVQNNAKQEEMPAVLYIISDMEFNSCVTTNGTNYQNAKQMFAEAGYKLPHVVFWQVNSRNDQVPATIYDNGVSLISGSSQSTFRYAVEGRTPLESMNDILNSERYSQIVLEDTTSN